MAGDEMKEAVTGYKIVGKDWTGLNDFKYELGKTYIHDGEVILCKSGFHFCSVLLDCMWVTEHLQNKQPVRFLKIKPSQQIKSMGCPAFGKSVTNHIEIIKELDAQEIAIALKTCKRNDYQRYRFLLHCLNWKKDDVVKAIWESSPKKRQEHFLEMSLYYGTCIMRFFKNLLELPEFKHISKTQYKPAWEESYSD